nr:zinc metalloproteinase nas-13-like isoform X1 [Leptinotarsa decemlineata]
MTIFASTLFTMVFFIFTNLLSCFPLEESDNSVDNYAIQLPIFGENAYREPDPEAGKRLESWNVTSEQNPEEYEMYLEGDILIPAKSRNGLVSEAFRWKNGVIPYEISGDFPSDGLNMITRAMNLYKKYTCVSFRPKVSTDEDYISITNDRTGCWSSVGRIGGRQLLNLQSPSCTTKIGTPVHELMHAAGFLHEQNRYERDDYVTIVWGNIKSGHEGNFNKAEKGTAQGYGIPYDFRSVMHYSNTAFSINGRPTIEPKDPKKVEKMGQRDGFSKGDITKINAMYNCPEKTAQVTVNRPSANVENNNSKEETNPLLQAANGLLALFINKK